ncbi:hypothetical protein ACX3VT_08780 [Aerococcus sanguinicola]|uniref:hypothetical protein n=1 Tax=unclassified Aerococcus TaxID=2618060 RepID=UPI0008A2EBC7|nr:MULTISPECIES: hypothetical protein [unclassified Aerococcus]MDK6233365.1 hypothetical protein [Aerococcus sp. UMB10185]MDK6855194.1 hypothetical protein [Aerococcus sp. UMB7533]OFN04374.1 hypothetical protein HMPREF2626_00625 [Aerococcus sp. HMSC062A02]OHO43065.1 hypothetical protein HMPREF2705_02035 [Aerococcus sp. HMSC035B07]
MQTLEEVKEARQAAQELLAGLDKAIKSLQDASGWGVMDLLGGGFFSSMMKRDHMKRSNQELEDVKRGLDKLDHELADLGLSLPDEISDTWGDNIVDVWLDNIFIDAKVQYEIKDQLKALQKLRQSIVELEEDLAAKMENLKESDSV